MTADRPVTHMADHRASTLRRDLVLELAEPPTSVWQLARAFHDLARLHKAGGPPWPAVIVTVATTHRGHPFPSRGHVLASAIAALEGVAAAGVITSAGTETVRYLGLAAPELADQDRLVLAIEPYEQGDTAP